ncbi:MAG: hypothetical protein ACYSUI_22345, partial [Planctomycetota bacterium]
MNTQRTQNRIKKLAVSGILVGMLLAGTGCDLEDAAAKTVVNAARAFTGGTGGVNFTDTTPHFSADVTDTYVGGLGFLIWQSNNGDNIVDYG